MKILIVAISIGILCITALNGYAMPYPADIPENFQHTNVHVFCERSEPTPLYQRIYIMPKQWLVVVIGRDATDLLLLYSRPQDSNAQDITYRMTPDGWQQISFKESGDYAERIFASEELDFFKMCSSMR